MPPSASDPKDLKLVLNPARQKAFTLLIGSIITQMRKQIEYSFDTPSTQENVPLFASSDSPLNRPSSPSFPTDPEEEERKKQLEARLERSAMTPKLNALKRDALKYFDKWANEVRIELRRTMDSPEDSRSQQRRREWLASRNPAPPPYTPNASLFKTSEQEAAALAAESRNVQEAKDVSLLQSLYISVPTRFTTVSKEDRTCIISCLILLLLSLGHYSAHSRTLLCYLTSSFALPLSVLINEELEISRTLLLASKTLTADAETQKRQAENATSRKWKVGLASIAGAAVIGITGGLAAPVVAGAIGGLMSGVGLGGVASFLGIFAMNGALVGSLFGAFGGKMTGEMVDAYAKEVEDFKFLPVASEWGEHTTHPSSEEEARRLRVTIGINGWLASPEDVIKPWRVLGKDSEVFALRYEMDALLALGSSLQNMVSSYAWSYVKLEILKRTVLATLWSALWPVYLLKMATSIDNPFAVARNRSEKAGEVLADALINKAQGERPVTLIGYSLGARVIYSCLKSLASRRAFGLVESVILIGAPIPSNSSNWLEMRSVVSGKVFNVYSQNDYILAFLYRATSIQFGVAGLQEIKDVEGINNLDLSKEVSGHLRYPELVGKILKRIGVESVNVEDEDIEEDASPKEIKLVDDEDLIDFGEGIIDKPSGGFRIVEDEREGEENFMDMNRDSKSPAIAPENNILFEHPLSATSMPVLRQTFDTHTLPSPSRPQPQISHSAPFPITHIDDNDEYSSDESTSIRILDNDEPLTELDCEPVPDDYDLNPPFTNPENTTPSNKEVPQEDPRDNEKSLFEEQKSLGVMKGMGGSKGSSIVEAGGYEGHGWE